MRPLEPLKAVGLSSDTAISSIEAAYLLTDGLDIFEKDAAPLILAEVEFPSEEEARAFTPPEWFAEDVTFSPCYHNSYISRYGYRPEP